MSIYSNLHLDDIKVLESILSINDKVSYKEWTGNTALSIIPTFQISKENQNEGRLLIDIKMFDEDFIKNGYPFFLRIIIAGYFSLNEDENIIEQYALNMTSVLLPYARSYIAALTGLSGIDAVHLPAINVERLFMELEDEDGTIEVD